MKCLLPLLSLLVFSCQATETGTGWSESGSTPINGKEELAYKRALLKCYKTGGSRVVKIQGKLRCY